MKFTPKETSEDKAKVPFFEDARSDYAPYYSASAQKNWTINKAKNAIQVEMGKLGGTIMGFDEGDFGEEVLRPGYRINFMLNGRPGRISIVCLPIRRWTQNRHEAVRVQALLIIRDWLKAQVTSMIFSPGNNPLIPHLLDAKKDMTFAEMIAAQEEIDVPRISAPAVEGEIVE